jgi:hypothetical protein
MKKFYYLVNHEFRQVQRLLFAVCCLLIAGQLLFMGLLSGKQFAYIPYEEFFMNSGSLFIFLLCFAAICGICILSIFSNYYGSKSIYTLLALPQDRNRIYYAKVLTGLACFLMLLACQYISAVLGYALFTPKLVEIMDGQATFRRPANGLFLAFARLPFFRLILPLGIEGLLSSVAMLLSFICSLYHTVICERSRKYLRLVFPVSNIVLNVYIVAYRINNLNGFWPYRNLYLLSLVLAASAVFLAWDSIRLIRRSAIV